MKGRKYKMKFKITKTTLWKHTRSGKLKSFGIGNRVFYSKKQILEAVKPTKD